MRRIAAIGLTVLAAPLSAWAQPADAPVQVDEFTLDLQELANWAISTAGGGLILIFLIGLIYAMQAKIARRRELHSADTPGNTTG